MRLRDTLMPTRQIAVLDNITIGLEQPPRVT